MYMCVCRKFNKTIEILQGDIESLENDKQAMERRLDQESKNTMLADTTSRRLRGSSFGNVFGLREQQQERSGGEGAAGEVQQGAPSVEGEASPLLLARVCEHVQHTHVRVCTL